MFTNRPSFWVTGFQSHRIFLGNLVKSQNDARRWTSVDPSVPTPLVKDCSMVIHVPAPPVCAYVSAKLILIGTQSHTTWKSLSMKCLEEGTVRLYLLEVGRSVWKLLPQQRLKTWIERIWNDPQAVFNIGPLSMMLWLVGNVGRYMSRWQNATLAVLSVQYSGRVTSTICFCMGNSWNSVFHGKGKSEVFWPFLKSQWCTKYLTTSPLSWKIPPIVLRFGNYLPILGSKRRKDSSYYLINKHILDHPYDRQ